MPSLSRSFVAVFVGFMVMVIVSRVIFSPLFVSTMGRQTSDLSVGYLIANAVYSVSAVFVGGLAAAFVAQAKPIQHTAALAALIFAVGMLSYLHYVGPQPLWYRIGMQIVSPLSAVAAGALYARGGRRSIR
jgi:hypothetical protein